MVSIRDAQISDLPAMLAIYNHAVNTLVATFDLEEQTLEQREVWFHKHGGRYPLIVAEDGDEVIGYCCLSAFREKPAYGNTAELSIYIAENQRGKSVGSALMRDIQKRTRELGFHVVISGITGGNEASVRLHEKFGFTLVGKLREVGYKFGEWHDVHYYEWMVGEEHIS
ncbi:GNAT family N-acetyltransferase [Brevibacillus choshinensis]|uniref:N-acetyltransferase n=1 Tax=Brevibacillus choshinensis TaxID=54911 RepID=A0ABX7FQ88_BRECH|nr:GNAT family N-acetyltransferase [Brevibacillus choshinensis]QRG68413.1 N-acetyltransferase [Brevibacillus choshinensis]